MIRLLDLPGLQSIENTTTLDELVGIKNNIELDNQIDAFKANILGVPHWKYHDFGSAYWERDDVYIHATPEQWKLNGWDVLGDDGKPLRCLPRIAEALAAASMGLGEKTVMEIDRDVWRARKANDDRPARHKQDEAFLALGQRKRRQR